jgi:hypothetical protein
LVKAPIHPDKDHPMNTKHSLAIIAIATVALAGCGHQTAAASYTAALNLPAPGYVQVQGGGCTVEVDSAPTDAAATTVAARLDSGTVRLAAGAYRVSAAGCRQGTPRVAVLPARVEPGLTWPTLADARPVTNWTPAK